MATRSGFVRATSSHVRTEAFDQLDVLQRAGAFTHRRLSASIASRRTRARLGMVGVPLAIAVALMSAQWWAILPLTACAWWWAPHDWGWEWLGAVGRGVITTEWGYMGAGGLAFLPGDRLLVGAIWTGLPSLLAIYVCRRAKAS